ncbi:hypothetical protein KKZ62_24000 [Enterobacter hormaechei subsp. hoffmannii]|nr:hypothetical protein [Enterobacter hormaechei subsp. hoffmannii]
MASIVQNLLVAHFLYPGYPEINPNNSRVCMAIGKRQNQKESPEEELDHLLDQLELTPDQRNFIDSMRVNEDEEKDEKSRLYSTNT